MHTTVWVHIMAGDVVLSTSRWRNTRSGVPRSVCATVQVRPVANEVRPACSVFPLGFRSRLAAMWSTNLRLMSECFVAIHLVQLLRDFIAVLYYWNIRAHMHVCSVL